jgi:outer membrane protein assembly factor BamB
MTLKLRNVGSVLVILLAAGCSMSPAAAPNGEKVGQASPAPPALQNVPAGDWPMWCRTPSRNMACDEKNLPDSWDVGKFKPDSEEVDLSTTKNIKWVAKLGSQAYGNVAVSGGKVFIGTNNEAPRSKLFDGDRSVMMCIDEKTGALLWQFAIPKLGTGQVSDWPFIGICSSPAVEGDRLYFLTNRAEIVCMDVNGLANGNDGEVQDEAQYLAGPGKPPIQLGPQDGDIIWRFNMPRELGVFPHNIAASSPLIQGNILAVATANGVDWGHTTIPNPKAPALVMLDKRTGKLLGEEASGVSSRTLHSNWSSPALGKVGDEEQLIFGGGDGICYGFSTTPKEQNGVKVLPELWRHDCNPPGYREKDGKPLKYATKNGPSEVIATPVFYKNRVYVPIGQDPEHGEGIGNLSCIDMTRKGDNTKTGTVWSYDKIARSLSTAAIADGLVYIPDFSGNIHCLDAETGQPYWMLETLSHIWGSCLVADGKVYVGTEDGELIILQAGKTLKEIRRIDMHSPVYSCPVAADGMLFISTPTHLYCIGK